jgi:hypothetical protein
MRLSETFEHKYCFQRGFRLILVTRKLCSESAPAFISSSAESLRTIFSISCRSRLHQVAHGSQRVPFLLNTTFHRLTNAPLVEERCLLFRTFGAQRIRYGDRPSQSTKSNRAQLLTREMRIELITARKQGDNVAQLGELFRGTTLGCLARVSSGNTLHVPYRKDH